MTDWADQDWRPGHQVISVQLLASPARTAEAEARSQQQRNPNPSPSPASPESQEGAAPVEDTSARPVERSIALPQEPIMMSSSSTKRKRRKANDGGSPDNPSTKSWRDKAIDKFDLRPVPEKWKDAVALGDEDTWKRYYKYRSEIDDVDEDDADPEECPENGHYLREWKQTFAQQIEERMRDGCPWPWSPAFGCIVWDDDYIRTAEYFSHAWSPYAIPHAIEPDASLSR